MNVIRTTAPIAIQDLKLYFADKSTSYIIDYTNSSIKGEKLLTYLSNLDIPSDIDFDFNNVEHLELLKIYFETGFIVKVPALELAAIDCLLEHKGIEDSHNYYGFIKDNLESLEEWSKRLDSLTLFNLYSVNVDNFKDWVKDEYEEDTSDSSKYVNFVNLLQHEDFYNFYLNIKQDNLKYYSVLFNDYCFKGNNLYTYWANVNNPMFMLTYGISTGELNPAEYIASRDKDISDLEMYDL